MISVSPFERGCDVERSCEGNLEFTLQINQVRDDISLCRRDEGSRCVVVNVTCDLHNIGWTIGEIIKDRGFPRFSVRDQPLQPVVRGLDTIAVTR